MKIQAAFIILLWGFVSCQQHQTTESVVIPVKKSNSEKLEKYPKKLLKGTTAAIDTTQKWIELKSIDSSFMYDIRYATKNNFVHKKMYPCPKCFVRVEVAKALLKIQDELKSKGWKIKLFDCYRPGKVQQELWDMMPNPSYVANPKTGSMHNRGVAVDLTLVDRQGKELNMGTPYDYFGKKAYHAYAKLPDTVLKNRRFLKNIMSKYGLEPIKSEWWHYSYRAKEYPVEQWVWSCP